MISARYRGVALATLFLSSLSCTAHSPGVRTDAREPAVACAPARSAVPAKPVEPSAAAYAADVAFLAHPALQGRGLGTAGIDRAADWLEQQFAQVGLQPGFRDGYSRTFTAMVGARAGKRSSLQVGDFALTNNKQFRVFGLSSPGAVTAPVVFAGYGISAPEYGYDDYAGVDVRGKYVLLLRYEPVQGDKFEGKEWSEYATFRYKIFNARLHGAAGVLLVNGPKDKPGDLGDELVPVQSDPLAGAGFGIPMFHVARSAVAPLLARNGLDLMAFQRTVDATLEPASRLLDFSVGGTADIRRLSFPVRNVAGYLPGKDESRVVVIGAHYDHLGFGGPYKVTGPTERIHHGADDNASGTAAIVALARYYATLGERPPVSLLFVAFSGEESGLVGSTRFVQQLPIARTRIAAMLNLDMIGRMTNQRLQIFGTGSALEFPTLVTAAIPTGIEAQYHPAGFGPSDHAPFYGSGIPVLHFWTGSHKEYHTPADKPELLNVEGALAVIDTVRGVVTGISAMERLTYQGPPRPQVLYAAAEGGSSGEAFLGLAPSFTANFAGVLVASLVPGSPAAAVLEPGDQVLTLDGHRVLNFYELSYRLRRLQPGDDVLIGYARGGKLYEARIRLAGRP